MKTIFANWNQRLAPSRIRKTAVASRLLSLASSFTVLFMLGGCATAPTKFESVQKGQWQSKLLIRDLKQSKSQIVNIDVIAVRPKKMRLEVSSTMGMHLASFAMKDDRVQVLVPKQKKYFTGAADSASMRQVLGIDIDPDLFMNVLFDEELSGGDWSCRRDKKGYLEGCDSAAQGISVAWGDREVARRKVDIKAKAFSLQFMLQGFSTKVEETPDTFNLAPPANL